MDLLFSKYASPFILLEQMISLCRFSEFVSEFLQIEDDQKLWQLYLSAISNSFIEVGSFEDFKKKCTGKAEVVGEVKLEATVKESINILNNFNPSEGR